MVKEIHWRRVLKIAFGCVASILTAGAAGLQYSASAGIITILSIQNTKLETISVAKKRLFSFLSAMITAVAVFKLFGYSAYSFGIYLLLFVSVCFVFQWQEGIAMNSVLVTHLLAEKSTGAFWIYNETMLFLIGVGTGVLLNLSLRGKKSLVNSQQRLIEEEMRGILERMSAALKAEDKEYYDGSCFFSLEEKLARADFLAEESRKNSFSAEMDYYIEYIDMRKEQCEVLKRIYQNICLLKTVPKQTQAISDFIFEIGNHFHEFNNVKALLERLEGIWTIMKKEELPKTREEFEDRAILLQILYQFEEFLMIKRAFILKQSEEDQDRIFDQRNRKF